MAVQRGRGRKSRRGGDSINITSMMDMFTIILLFLLKSYSADGSILTNADDLILPNSVAKGRPSEVTVQLAVTPDMILIDNTPVVSTREVFKKSRQEFSADTTTAIDSVLQNHMRVEKELEKMGEIAAVKGMIIVQMDKNISFDILYKVMQLCGRNGFVNMHFAVMMREG